MCNRYKLDRGVTETVRLFDARADTGNSGPGTYHPKSTGIVIRTEQGERVANGMTWGFPRVMRGKQGQMLKPIPVNNARSEKLATPFWKGAAANPAQRCLIPMSAFAEAMGEKGKMTSTWLSLPDQPLFACAGLWRDSAEWGRCYTMVMCDNRPDLAYVHDRMPVILSPDNYDHWLNDSLDGVIDLCRPWQGEIHVDETDILWSKGGSG